MRTTYRARRSEVALYFDRTAADTWARLTSDRPVSRIRATVRAGRDRMRNTLLSWLGEDLRGQRILDAGCGTGAFAVDAARRGAEVVAVDLAENLIEVARERVPRDLEIDFRAGDMLDARLGRFDHVVAMDSLIHYRRPDMMEMLAGLASRAEGRVLFTFAPRTPLLTFMHLAGRLFPRSNRAPAIEPVAVRRLKRRIGDLPALDGWAPARTARIRSAFYICQAMELVRS